VRAHAAPIVLGTLAALLLLANLGGQSLWQDEAQTALLARSVLVHGLPLGTDGRNFFSQESGAEYGPGYAWRWHTWLPFYVLAGFFAAFGETTFVARLPFALFGAATVVACFFLARELWRTRRAATLAAGLLLTSVPFLILSRQCRYYSPAAFFTVVALHAYVRTLGKGRAAPWVFVAASVALFHTHYVYWAALLAAVLGHAFLFHAARRARIASLAAISLLLVLPWALWVAGMPYGARYGETLADPGRRLRLLLRFSRGFVQALSPAGLVLLASLPVLSRTRRERPAPDPLRPSALLLLFTGANIAALALSAPGWFFRYLAPLLPVACLLVARALDAWMERRLVLGLAGLAVVLAFQPLAEYLYEITHRFEGPIDGIVRYLKEHGSASDVVAITYGDLPLKFYTGMRVLGGLTGEDLAPAKNATWVIVRRHVLGDPDAGVRRYLIENVPWERYERIVIDSPDTMFQNREDPKDHRFRTSRDEEPVVIFRRARP